MKSVLLHHFNLNRRTKLEIDVSGFMISSIFSQFIKNENWVLVTFYSQKMSSAELNYRIHN